MDNSFESFITFNDNLIIAEESLRNKDIDKLLKKEMTDILNKEEKAYKTKDMYQKLILLKELRTVIGNTLDMVKEMTPDKLDMALSLLSSIGRVGTFIGDSLAVGHLSLNAGKFMVLTKSGVISPEISGAYLQSVIKNVAGLVLIGKIDKFLKKGNIAYKTERKEDIIVILNRKYIEIDEMIHRLES